MDLFWTYTVLGLVMGAVYAIAASGLVLTYNTSGVFNFAHGAMAMLAAFLYWQFAIDWGMPEMLALLLVVCVAGPLFGVLLHLVVMRHLHGTEPVTKVIVTIAVLMGMVALSHWIWDPTTPRTVPMLFGSQNSIEVGGVVLRFHEILCLAAAALLAIALRLLFVRTRFGVSMRAVVDDPELLRLNGFSPDRIAMISWATGSALAALAGVLITPIAGGSLEATILTVLLIDAFAAALLGRLRSIPMTFVGAMIIGLSMTYLIAYAPTGWDWIPSVRSALPMLLLLLVLVLLPQDRLRGGHLRTRERISQASVRQAVIWGVVLVGVMVALLPLMGSPMRSNMTIGLAFAVIALSLTPLTGFAGEVNLAPVSFAGVATIAAYHFGISGAGYTARTEWWGLIIATVLAAAVGALVALPALRLRGLYLALATVAFGGIVSRLVLRETRPRDWFGHEFALFPDGFLVVPPLRVGPLDLADEATALVTVSAIFAVLGVLIIVLRNSGRGRRLIAMKDSPAALAMVGESLMTLKLAVFMLSAGIAGLGGVLVATAVGSVSGEDYALMASLSLVMLTAIGGMGHVSGALFGGVAVGAGFSLLNGSLGELGAAQPALASGTDFMTNLFAVGVAAAGIGVARNPSGLVVDICEPFHPLRHQPRVVLAGIAVLVGWYVAALFDVVTGGWFLLGAVVIVFSLPPVGRRLAPATADAESAGPTPEFMGLGATFTPDEIRLVDAHWRIPAPAVPAGLPGGTDQHRGEARVTA